MPYEASLRARPVTVTSAAPTGQQPLPYGTRGDSYFYVPPTYDVTKPSPLVLLLHGAGGHAHHGLDLLQQFADSKRMILVAPTSNSHTWDVIVDRDYGPDTALIDEALLHVLQRYAVDARHVAIGGFSDGASYGLSIGLANGELFTHVIAFSPGFIAPLKARGKPKVFISHGRHDEVLPIASCSGNIVPRLEEAGYDVAYHEFDDGHTVPPDIARSAVDWFLD